MRILLKRKREDLIMIRANKRLRFKISLKRRSVSEWLAILILILPFCFDTFIVVFGVPDAVQFVLDLFLAYFCHKTDNYLSL